MVDHLFEFSFSQKTIEGTRFARCVRGRFEKHRTWNNVWLEMKFVEAATVVLGYGSGSVIPKLLYLQTSLVTLVQAVIRAKQ
mmetsp:Transcript_19011/g.35489  ORF Transcript_19011/g.35489 Transcript_19011/m.35489 type:complete len:82 (+) Transcript_19011:612-857(+)